MSRPAAASSYAHSHPPNPFLERAAVSVSVDSNTTQSSQYAPSSTPIVLFSVDRSGSMSGHPIAEAMEGVLHMVDSLPSKTRIGVQVFNSQADIAVPLQRKRDIRDLAATLDSMCVASGSTLLYDAVISGQQQIMKVTKKHGSSCCIHVILTDGQDTRSSATLEQMKVAIDQPGFANAHVIFIGVGMASAYEQLLRTLSVKPHFSYISCANGVGEIAKTLKRVSKQVRTITESITIQVRTQATGGDGSSSSSGVLPQQLLGMLASMALAPGGPQIMMPQQMQAHAFAPRSRLLLPSSSSSASAAASYTRPHRASTARVELIDDDDDKYKTVMCRNYIKGHCPFGASCKFAHGQREVRQH